MSQANYIKVRDILSSVVLSIGLSVVLGLSGCASRAAILEPVPVDSAATDLSKAVQENPAYTNLVEKLKANQYEAAGLQYESDATLKLLGDVFGDKRSSNRQITTVYTGIALSYDPTHKSLTVGGTSDKEAILKFIEKNIPLR